ncbi:hypothetical protein CUMW_288910 [Citrus unshiu]|uniref:Uncharacterized protein n=1 Tax=Citrus unshiu TaxID=55188 RepID=A0A2H5QYE7_CITUN|nr:hypothetical protein CUMW_288910 [Citrus unshiu]
MRNGHVQIVGTKRSALQQARIRCMSQARTDRLHSVGRQRPITAQESRVSFVAPRHSFGPQSEEQCES